MRNYILFILLSIFILKVNAQIGIFEHTADSLYLAGKYDAAIDLYTKILDSDSAISDLYYKRGNSYFMKKKNMKAFEDYNKSIDLDSMNGEAYAARSAVRFKLGNTNAAIKDRDKSEILGVSSGVKDTYQASNGVNYFVGDSVKLGMGSNPDGKFKFLNIGGWGAALMATERNFDENSLNLGRSFANMKLHIKKIKRYKFKGNEKVYFVVAGGNITNYWLYIEEAIQTCEVIPCNRVNSPQTTLSIADEILKAKKLLDDGLITKEEFDKIKIKLIEK